MKRATEILKEVETMLLQAEIRISLVNGELGDPVTDKESALQILELEKGLEGVHTLATKLENTLLKKINSTMKKRIESLSKLEAEIKNAKTNQQKQ